MKLGLCTVIALSTSSIQPGWPGVIRACAKSRREPAKPLISARASAICALDRNHQVGSSNGAPLSKARLVSLS